MKKCEIDEETRREICKLYEGIPKKKKQAIEKENAEDSAYFRGVSNTLAVVGMVLGFDIATGKPFNA